MKNILRSSVMMAALLGAALLPVAGQVSSAGTAGTANSSTFDLGVTYTAKVAKISNLSNSNFVLQGGAVDGVYWMNPSRVRLHNLGVAFDFSAETKSNITPGLSLHQFSLVAGPRYTLWRAKGGKPGPNLYGQALVGFVHASHSYFPVAPNSTKPSATSIALQTGGGLNVPVGGRIGLRVAEIDYIMTHLPNNADSYQGDMRFSTGITFRFGK